MSAPVRINLSFVDEKGGTARTGYYIPLADFDPVTFVAMYADLHNAVDGVTAMKLFKASATINFGLPGFVLETGEPYADNQDKALSEWTDEDGGNSFSMAMPGPKQTVFTTNAETLDKVDAAVAELIVQVLFFCATKAGKAIIGLYKGWRYREPGTPT